MIKDMQNGEVREYNGKKYMYKVIEAMETDINFLDECCDGCSFKRRCKSDIQNTLGECYEVHRLDKSNGIFEEIE